MEFLGDGDDISRFSQLETLEILDLGRKTVSLPDALCKLPPSLRRIRLPAAWAAVATLARSTARLLPRLESITFLHQPCSPADLPRPCAHR